MDKLNKIKITFASILEPCALNYESAQTKGDPVCNFIGGPEVEYFQEVFPKYYWCLL
jgi:hypothetical protein